MAPLAKVTRPSPAGLVPRARLFRLLDRQRGSAVSWITGPAGSGKTSLVASYLAARRLRALWYRLDDGDGDLATFFYYLGRAARTARPGTRQTLPLLTPEYAPDALPFARRYFERLFSCLPASSLVVLDNYQEVAAQSPLHGVLARVLADVPRGVRVVIVSRHAPPPAFARLRAHGAMGLVGWDALRLSLDESRRIARARGARGLSRAALEAAHARADGWAAGLVMIVEGTRGGSGLHHPPQHASAGEIFDYFASEVFGRADPATQELLLRTAFLPEVTIALAERLTESRQAARILTALGRSQYFTSSTSEREPVFQYHPLFREFLTARARQTLSAEALAALLQRAGALLEEAGQVEAAAALLTEAQASQALMALILRQAPGLAAQGRFQTLAGWIRALPEALRQQNAWLLYWLGVSVLPSGDIETSRQLLQQAFRSFEAHGDDGGCLLAWAAIVETILYAWDDFSLLDPWIRWLEERSSTGTPFPTPQIEAAVTIAMTGALVFRPAQVDPRPWIAAARRLLREAPDLHARLRAGSYLGLYAFWMGHFPVVREIVDEIRRISRAPHAPPLSAITWRWFEGAVLTFDAMEPEACLSLTDATLQLAERSGVHMLDFMVLAQGVNASLNFGDIARARAYLARMAEVAQGRNGRAYYQYLASWEAFLSGDEPRALTRAEEALRLAVESGMPFAEALAQLALAHLLHDRDRREDALQHLRAARLIADSTGSSYFDFACSLAEARFAGAAGERTRMLEALRRMLTVGASQGIGSIYWWVPEWITPLCGEALRAGIEPEYARRLIRQWQLFPEAPPYDCERWPWEIRIHTLGRFDVERDGQLVVYGTKAPRRILTLLRILVAHGSRGATEECLADLLWPRAEGDAARRALATSLHRLRRLLGSERAVLMRDGRVTLDARRCWVDAHAFEALLRGASDSRGAGPAADASAVDAEQQIAAALALYTGPFLTDSEEPWAVAGREKLRAQLVRAVAEHAAAQERAGRPDAALALYLRYVEADDGARPLAAEAVRRLRAAGRGHEAAALARRAGVSEHPG